MGLTSTSTGIKASYSGMTIDKNSPNDRVIALAGNPNVGKSTVFNELTGLNQHTGNWAGKTVTNAQGRYTYMNTDYIVVDIPGTYSLMAHSVEEEIARDFICFGHPDTVVVVCDATCIERNLNLVLQTIEMCDNVIVCLNLMDEAKRKNIKIDTSVIQSRLGVPVVETSARNRDGIDRLVKAIANSKQAQNSIQIKYTDTIENAIQVLEPYVSEIIDEKLNSRWVCIRLLENDMKFVKSIDDYLGYEIENNSTVSKKIKEAKLILESNGLTRRKFQDEIVSCIVSTAEKICKDTISFENSNYNHMDRKIDKILTDRWTGIPIMLLLLFVIFWITIVGANYPSQLISNGLFWVQDRLTDFFVAVNAPSWLHGILVLGIYRVLAWVVSVMLPPMAIFFPLFTLLEDLGYLPRIAFNLDKHFKKCCACGKQALTMCMGFGCNAAGVIGCRIIDSPRERLIAIITNNFVPCNGRFPMILTLISIFFVMGVDYRFKSLFSALILTAIILFGIVMTFVVSKILSKTILKGVPSSFTLELPPFRKPQFLKIIVHSIFDRTLFVLGRAIIVAAPAGMIIWLMANITVYDITILNHCANFLNPFAHLIGLDGVILIAFILGFPANEIVVPIMIMAYLSNGTISDMDNLMQLKTLFIENGWTWLTAVCTIVFSLMHWPCSTTCLTIKKETQSWKWTFVSFLVPTVMGIIICFVIATVSRILGFV